MPYTVPALDQLRTLMLRDIKNLLPEADIGEDSDYYVRASSVASAVEGLYQHQTWISKQIFPDSADHDFLILHAALRGMNPKPAVKAGGRVTLTGAANTPIASALALKHQNGVQYLTTEGGQLDANGSLTVPATALAAGIVGNLPDGAPLTLTMPPARVNSTATALIMKGGTDIEPDDALLARLLQRIRRPPAGGNKYDYWQWAMEVPGVTAAYVYPLRRGPGTVDTVIASNGGLPSDEVLAAAQVWIDDQRPVTAKNSRVIQPTLKVFDLKVAVRRDGISREEAHRTIQAASAAYVAPLVPGEAAIRSRLEAVISDLSGIRDRHLIEPWANVTPTADATRVEWCRLGTVTVEDMA
jgi:uncharacterized phage protein gp47/JayE